MMHHLSNGHFGTENSSYDNEDGRQYNNQDETDAMNSSSTDKKRETRRRTKTGCLTCRKRRIKCDEGKPECTRCIKSKRTCEGYSVKAVFRNENPMHYQQNIRPSVASRPFNDCISLENSIRFSTPQYHLMPATNATDSKPYGLTSHPAASYTPIHPNLRVPTGDPASRNSSASNASGVSANSEQRRISVLSLMSPVDGITAIPEGTSTTILPVEMQVAERTPATDARDNYLYNYYVSYYSFSLSRSMPEISNLPPSAPEHPAILWPHTIPSLISEDPPGRRPLFDAIVAYTACIRFEKILVNFEVQSSGQLAQLIELSLKSYLDIMQDTTNMLTKVEALFDSEDPLRLLLRWRLLQHTIVQILGDANPRIAWVNYLGTKAFSSSSFLVTNDVQRFYIEALRHTLSGAQQIPRQIIDMRQKYDFLAVPGVDLVYFAFIMDITSLQNICYHILSHPRLEYLYLASLMVSGARIRGEPCLDALATDLDTTMRSMSG